jgi:GlpG protein
MGVCVIVALNGLPPASTSPLRMSAQSASLPEIRHGEVWRLLTPIFIHMGLLHILFNMLWLKDLGSMIEARMGTLKLLLLVVVIGIGSNLGQDWLFGPWFGGMSGVIYGLFGFIWMRGKFDAASGLRLPQADVVMMVGWFFLCLFGIIPNVANAAHGFGLVMGMIWGAAPPLAKKLFRP